MAKKVAAAVLCGGRGERLRPLTDFFQKSMIPVGPKKRPLLEYIVRLLAYHGVQDIALLTGYRSEEIREYFGEGSSFGVKLRYSEDPKSLSGSLNAVSHALANGTISRCDQLLIYYGDVISDLDVSALLSLHARERADATLVLAEGYTLPVGVATVRRGRFVVKVVEKPTLDINVMTGCMTVGPKAMKLITSLAGKEKTDLMRHFVPDLLERGGKVAAFYTKGIWRDLGSLTNYENLNSEVKAMHLPFVPDGP